MSKYTLPNYTLPKNNPSATTMPTLPSLDMSPPAVAEQTRPPTLPSMPGGPAGARVRASAGKVFGMLKRLYASYRRSSAVHHARVDAALSGSEGHLMLHYFHSAK